VTTPTKNYNLFYTLYYCWHDTGITEK